jgi:hypothetical protein
VPPKIGVLKEHLINELNSALGFNLARVKCLALLIASLLRHRTVNLAILATENLSGATNESCYRRFQNFFLRFALPLDLVGGLILSKLPRPSDGWVLSMDRTNWKYGSRHINILTVGVVINRIAIPIAWKVLPQTTKRGNSNTSQRIDILKKVLRLLAPEEIRVLTMDREFGGKQWLRWLDARDVGYIVRVKSNTQVSGRAARLHPATGRRAVAKRVLVWGLPVFFANKRITARGRRDEYLHVISNRFSGREALALYRLRWGIEQLFSHLKKRGFNFESTHMTDGSKLERLFAVVSVAFLYSYAWGCQLRKSRKETKATRRKSLFRLGLEGLLRLFGNPHLKTSERTEFLDWLKSPVFTAIFVV